MSDSPATPDAEYEAEGRLGDAKDARLMVESLVMIAERLSRSVEERGRIAFYKEYLAAFFGDLIARAEGAADPPSASELDQLRKIFRAPDADTAEGEKT